jgi:hypothetical protein
MGTLTMGRLKPGATYIYEKANGVTYAREIGAHPGDRFEIGRDHPSEPTFLGVPVKEVGEMVVLHIAAKTNPAIQDLLDQAKMLYELTREQEETKPGWHPV